MTVTEHPAPAFDVYIGIRPVRDGFVLDPAAINLSRSGAERMTPSRILGIFDCGIEQSHLVWRSLPIDPIVLRQGIGTCFGIEFQIPAPDPAEKFSIQVTGLSMDGMPRTRAAPSIGQVEWRSAKRPLTSGSTGSSPATCDHSRYEGSVGITQFIFANFCV
jgi:hypothetical protein